MKKLMLALVILVITATSVHAQNKTNFSIGIEPSLPIGTFGDIYSFGIGGSLQVEHMTASNVGLTLNGGYLNYSVKSSLGSGSVGFVPLLAGAKYYFSSKTYVHGQLGATFVTSSGGGTYFTYSPGIGFIISRNIDALVKYTGISSGGSSLNAISLRLSYTFGK